HHCHGGFNFTLSTVHQGSVFEAEDFHNTGLYSVNDSGAYPEPNTGVHAVTGDFEDMGKFRAPTLRNVELTAPYMHDGSIETLEGVIRHYEAGGRNVESGPYAGDGRRSPLKSGFVQGFSLTDRQRDDLLEFLLSLTDESFVHDPRFARPGAL
ncbi:MAG: di-heme enzyme, partial [Myxococcota bacterium]